MFVKKHISSEDIDEDPTGLPDVPNYPTKYPVFLWPQHSYLIEKIQVVLNCDYIHNSYFLLYKTLITTLALCVN